MRKSFIVTILMFITLQGTVQAGAARGCANVSALVETPVSALLANPAVPTPNAVRLAAQFHDCLTSRNICGIVSRSQNDGETLITADTTRDLPSASERALFILRSIPRLRNDSNQYCLVAQRAASAPLQQWIVYGWVIPANAGPILPLQKQSLDDTSAAHGESLRALAAALWSFAERMSGQ